MNKKITNETISNFIGDNLSPTGEEKLFISKKYEELKKILLGVEIFQSGSYARSTSITPVNDLDIIWVIPSNLVKQLLLDNYLTKIIDAEKLDVENLLEDLAQKLQKEYQNLGENVKVKVQSHSVGIYFGNDDEFSIDVVPAIGLSETSEDYSLELYKVPSILKYNHTKRQKIYNSGIEISWIKSDPRGYKKQAQIVEEETNGVFRKSVRLIKKWRTTSKEASELFKLKSFHLEMLITEYLKLNTESSILDTIKEFYTELPGYIIRPIIKDRADDKKFIDSYVDELTENEISEINKAKNYAVACINKIEKASTKQEIIEAIEQLIDPNRKTNNIVKPPSFKVDLKNTSKPWINQ